VVVAAVSRRFDNNSDNSCGPDGQRFPPEYVARCSLVWEAEGKVGRYVVWSANRWAVGCNPRPQRETQRPKPRFRLHEACSPRIAARSDRGLRAGPYDRPICDAKHYLTDHLGGAIHSTLPGQHKDADRRLRASCNACSRRFQPLAIRQARGNPARRHFCGIGFGLAPFAGCPGVRSGMGAWVQPPVSATNDQVYFRDGDTRIRMLEPPSNAVDVTTVPGNTNLVSSFSVSPDDQRIAVAVEDFSAASTIGIRLYVEDLRGGGHHSDIYTTTTPKGKGATTLFPMGWHQGRLILGVWAACTFEIVPNPNAWHVVDSSTAVRQAAVGDTNCIPSAWPSPAGVACFALHTNQVRVYDWTGALTATLQTQTGATQLSLWEICFSQGLEVPILLPP
jgi:hypothetical protein